jgi:hypothetical protein
VSLDVYLKQPGRGRRPEGSGIFVRENGRTVEISRKEWDKKFPGREPVVFQRTETDDGTVFSANITHNLNRMAGETGIYGAVWRPDENGIRTARQLIDHLKGGIERLEADPAWFKRFNPENGWGTYDVFVPWLKDYLAACEKYPDAEVEVSR